MEEKYALPVAKPEETGLSSKTLIRFLNSLELKGLCMHSFIAVHKEKMIAEGYWKPFNREKKHRMYSVGKSFVSIAVGFLAEEGFITLDDNIVSYFPEKLPAEGVHPYISSVKIRDLLMMASVHETTSYQVIKDDDWVKTFFICEPSHMPGAVFTYDSSASHILSALIEKLTGKSFLDYLRPRLLDHLGFSEDAYCLTDPMGIAQGGSGLICTSRDLAKVALTCMHNGRYLGRQLIPEGYIKEATSKQIENFVTGKSIDERQGYGYKFWRLRNNSFAFFGMGSQLAICIPDKDFMLVTTGDNQHIASAQSSIYEALWDEIFPYLGNDELPSDDNAYAELKIKLENLSVGTVEGSRNSSMLPHICGKEYQMDKNRMGIKKVVFDFNENGGVMRFQKDAEFSLRFGYGENVMQNFPENNYECIASAAWANDNALNISCFIIDDYLAPLFITAYFKDNTLTLHMMNSAENFINDYKGYACGGVL